MSIDSKDLIAKLVETIASGKDYALNNSALNFPQDLSIAIFNYPIAKNDKFCEFAEATERISAAKYAYYKKSATFKESITKLIINTFNKHHQNFDSLDHSEQIQRVQTAEKLVKFIGELYKSGFYSNENLVYFCLFLRKNSEVSKISEICLSTLVSIVDDRARNEAKQYKHNIHTAAILDILNEVTAANNNGRSRLEKKNYKDLEIIEAVMKNKLCLSSSSTSSRKELVRQTKKIFEMILSGSVALTDCVQKAYDSSIIFPDHFESEMLQLCIDYLKKALESNIDPPGNCESIVVFVGKLFDWDALSNDAIRGVLSFLSTRDSAFSKPLLNALVSVIYEKIVEIEELAPFIPEDFIQERFLTNGHGSDENGEAATDVEAMEQHQKKSGPSASTSTSSSVAGTPQLTPKRASKISDNGLIVVTSMNGENSVDPIEKFKELLQKLSLTNVAYILRETSQIRFGKCGEEIVKKIATAVIDHAINKQALIKAIVEIAAKLHETIVPHFNASLMRKHLKATISSKISKCSERETTALCQLVGELHTANFYDRFDVILLLESFTENFNTDRTAIPSLLKFTAELEEVIGSKKLSKNMKIKLMNIAELLVAKKDEDIHCDIKDQIDNAIKILRGEKDSKIKREESIEDYQEDFSEYRYDGTNEEYVISVESLPQSSAKIALVPSAKNKQQQPQMENSNNSETCSNSSHSFPQSNSTAPPIVLPPMHMPPPMMLIAPPVILPTPPIAMVPNMPPPLSPFHAPVATFASSFNRPMSMSFPSLLETVNAPASRDSSQSRPQSESFNNRHSAGFVDDQSVSSSRSIADVSESQFNDNTSDELYDTVSNDEISAAIGNVEPDRSESANSSLREDLVNEEDKFKNLIRSNFPLDIKDMENFATIFLERGMRCMNRGYIQIIDVVADGLKNNMQLYESFLRIFETKIFEFVKTLSQREYASSSECDKSLRLILLAAETYNEGLMKSDTLFACMEVLFNSIADGRSHQITMFHQLIKISLNRVVENGLQNIYKSYLDRLSQRLETFSDSYERNLLSWEIFVTMKVLLYRTQQARQNCPITYFKTFLKDLNEDNFSQQVGELKERLSVDKKQLTEIVEIFISAALHNYQIGLLIGLGSALKGLTANDVEDFTFKKYLEAKAHNDIRNCLADAINSKKTSELVMWISFISDLFLGNVASIYLILFALEMLLEKEIFNCKIVDCINILLRKIGFKIDEENILILDKFFLFFNRIASGENSYRSKIYRDLVKLRSNNWQVMEEDRDLEMIEDLLRKLNNQNFNKIAMIITGLVCKSAEVFKSFLALLWKFILMNPDLILKYAKLTQTIAGRYGCFAVALMTFLKHRNQTFKTLLAQGKFNEDVKKKLSTTTRFVAYCYAFNCASDEDLLLWLKPNFIDLFSVEEKTEIQILTSSKISESGNNELMGFLGIIEYQTREAVFSTLESVKNLLAEL